MSKKPTLDEIHERTAILEDSHTDVEKFDRLVAEFKAKHGREATIAERGEILEQCEMYPEDEEKNQVQNRADRAVILEDSHKDSAKFHRLLAEFEKAKGREATIAERGEILEQCEMYPEDD